MTIKDEDMYQEIVELEDLDTFISWDEKFIIGVLFLLVGELSKDKILAKKYKFRVIGFGFQGLYPVIGVKYLSDDSESVEDTAIEMCQNILRNKSMQDLIDFIAANKELVEERFKKIEKNNALFFKGKFN